MGDNRTKDLMLLQREYRHMELNRRAYAEESQKVLNRQKDSIEKLREDNDQLKNEISMIIRHQNRPASRLDQELINRLMDESDEYTEKIERERRTMATIVEQIALMKEKIIHTKKLMGGVNAPRENQMMVQKQIRILENRLEKALIRFNEAIARNKELREEIDHLRRERVVFDNVYRKMERELTEKKEQMAEVIETANRAYEKRDAYQMEIAAIDQANRREQDDFEEQMEQLTYLLDTELSLDHSNNRNKAQGRKVKSRQKSQKKTLRSSQTTKQLNISPVHEHGLKQHASQPILNHHEDQQQRFGIGFESKEDIEAKAQMELDHLSIATNKQDLEGSMRQIQHFEEAFHKIKAATGISDIDELVKVFIKNEDHNFSLFNYVNEQNNEIERLEGQLSELKEEEKAVEGPASGEESRQQKEIVQELEQQLQEAEATSERLEAESYDMQRVLDSLRRVVGSTYDALEEEGGEGESKNGGFETHVSDSNMVKYLGVIEKKGDTIVKEYMKIRPFLTQQDQSEKIFFQGNSSSNEHASIGISENRKEEEKVGEKNPSLRPSSSSSSSHLVGAGPHTPMGQDNLHINPPKLEDYSSDDLSDEEEESFRPLTKEELKTRTMNRMNRRGFVEQKNEG